ncbi:MAG: SpoIIIAH-like family protein [Bacillota bacterium]
MEKKKYWLIGIILGLIFIYLLVSILEKEMSLIEVAPDESIIQPLLAEELPDDPTRWKYDDAHAFFVEYRLERDRVRGQELEMLNDIINNTHAGAETRREAEIQVLKLVELMEKELIIENMLKAQGYKDAIFFGGRDGVTVMVHTEHLTEEEFWRIADMVAAVAGFSREKVQVIQQR